MSPVAAPSRPPGPRTALQYTRHNTQPDRKTPHRCVCHSCEVFRSYAAEHAVESLLSLLLAGDGKP